MNPSANKETLRQQVRARLATIGRDEIAAKSAQIYESVIDTAEVKSAQTIFIYVSQKHEVDTHRLIRCLLAQKKWVCVPAYDEKQKYYFPSLLGDFDHELKIGKFEILEPKVETRQPLGWDKIDVVIAPGLAFDVSGNRLGRGRGYYDSILSKVRCPKIGLAFACQIVDSIPTESYDVPVDIVVTEEQVIHTTPK